MFNRNGFTNVFSALALATCSAFAASSAVAAADFPTGTYAAKGLTVTFDDKGQFRVHKGEAMEVEGEYTVNADQLQLTDQSGPEACTGADQATGTYGWKYDNATLTFRKVADKCDARSKDLTAQPWKKKP